MSIVSEFTEEINKIAPLMIEELISEYREEDRENRGRRKSSLRSAIDRVVDFVIVFNRLKRSTSEKLAQGTQSPIMEELYNGYSKVT